MNELALCIVNEGKDYQDRLNIARLTDPALRRRRWLQRVQQESDRQRREFDQWFTVAQERDAVEELEDYYQRHMAEF